MMKWRIKASCGHEYMTDNIYIIDLGYEWYKNILENEPCPHCMALQFNRKPKSNETKTETKE